MVQIIISITAIMVSAAYPLYFIVRKKRSAPPFALCAAILLASVLELLDVLTFLYPENFFPWKHAVLFAEALLPPAWLWFSLTYARQNEPRSTSVAQRLLLWISPLFAASVIILPPSAFIYSPDFPSERILFLGNTGFIFYLALLIYLIVALSNLEMTLTSAPLISRWKIKFELLGAGAFLAVLIFYYSHGLLFRTINMYLTPVRGTFLIIAVGMMTYSRLVRGNGVKVYVSRQMMYKSLVLLIVGIYLIGLGLTGEAMKHFGNGFHQALVITLAFTAGLGLVVTFLSETVKRKVRVFIHKNFYQNKYDYRTQWLQFTDRLSSSKSGDDLLHSVVMGFCDTFGMRCGALLLLDQERTTYHLAAGVAMDSVPVAFTAKDAPLAFIARNRWVADLREGNPAFNGEQTGFFRSNSLCYLIPLFTREEMDGFIVLGQPINENENYNYEDFDLMKTLARQTSSTLLNLTLSEQLACAREMAAIGKVSTFVLHDLKNLVSALSLMLQNAKEYIEVPAFQTELLVSLGNTVKKMNVLISRLKHLPGKNSMKYTAVDMLQLAYDTAALVKGGDFRVTGSPVIAQVDQNEIQKVALNLMLNAAEASDGKSPVTVEVGSTDTVYFRVRDEGCGIPDEFLRRRMFAPFQTTKEKGLGIGLYQCKQIVEAHGGKIEVVSEVNKGSEFTVWLPKPAQNSSEGVIPWKN